MTGMHRSILLTLNFVLHAIHQILIVFSLVGWIFCETRMLNLIVLLFRVRSPSMWITPLSLGPDRRPAFSKVGLFDSLQVASPGAHSVRIPEVVVRPIHQKTLQARKGLLHGRSIQASSGM